MKALIFVGIGGCLGAVGRYGLQMLVLRLLGETRFPVGTLVVNLLGCLAIGYLWGWSEFKSVFPAELRLFLFVGILGGVTTYSAYAIETFRLLRDGHLVLAASNVLVQTLLGLGAVCLGVLWAKS